MPGQRTNGHKLRTRALGVTLLAVCLFAAACSKSPEEPPNPVGIDPATGSPTTTAVPVSETCAAIRAFNFAGFSTADLLKDPTFSPTDPRATPQVSQLNAEVDTFTAKMPTMKEKAVLWAAYLTRRLQGETVAAEETEAATQANQELVDLQTKECPLLPGVSAECNALRAFNFADFSIDGLLGTDPKPVPATADRYSKNLDDTAAAVKTVLPDLTNPVSRRSELMKKRVTGETLSDAEKAETEAAAFELHQSQADVCPKE